MTFPSGSPGMPTKRQRPFLGHFADPSCPVRVAPGRDLTLQDIAAAARGDHRGGYARVVLDGDWRERCRRSVEAVQRAVDATLGRSPEELAGLTRAKLGAAAPTDAQCAAKRALIYGVTTGFGYFKSRPIDSAQAAEQMQKNILRSHATGTGAPMPTEVVRAMMLIRLRTFVEGYSGVRPEIVEFLVELLNRKVHPWVPEQGSVGSSGDLCPLAHLSLVFIGEGLAWLGDGGAADGYASIGGTDRASAADFQWDPRVDRRPAPRPASEALHQAGLSSRILESLKPKEGLALTNGTTATTAYAALAVYDAAVLYGSVNLAAALSLQSLLGFTRTLDTKVNALRRHSGQLEAAGQILAFAQGSALVNRFNDVQDAYSLRCAPAVHGAAATAIEHAWSIVEQEINAVTDNPVFFDGAHDGPPCDGYAACIWDAYSAGNFHGEPIGFVCDYLKIAVAELANISERRTQCLLDEHHNRGLPANLWPDRTTAGLNTGLMILQYAAAALVSENKVLAHPASVDSIPTSSNVEDHVAMATTAARHARLVIENTANVLAVELLSALQALDIRLVESGCGLTALSPVARVVRQMVREGSSLSPPVSAVGRQDDILWPQLAAIRAQLSSGEILRTALAAG